MGMANLLYILGRQYTPQKHVAILAQSSSQRLVVPGCVHSRRVIELPCDNHPLACSDFKGHKLLRAHCCDVSSITGACLEVKAVRSRNDVSHLLRLCKRKDDNECCVSY